MSTETWEQRRDRRLQDHYAEGVIKTTKNLYHEAYAQGRADLLEDVNIILVKALQTVMDQPFAGSWDSQALFVMETLSNWRKKTGGGS